MLGKYQESTCRVLIQMKLQFVAGNSFTPTAAHICPKPSSARGRSKLATRGPDTVIWHWGLSWWDNRLIPATEFMDMCLPQCTAAIILGWTGLHWGCWSGCGVRDALGTAGARAHSPLGHSPTFPWDAGEQQPWGASQPSPHPSSGPVTGRGQGTAARGTAARGTKPSTSLFR